MTRKQVEIDISKLGLTGAASEEEIFEAIRLKWLEIKGQVSIRPNGAKGSVIIGGQAVDVNDFIDKLKKEGLFIKSIEIGKPIDPAVLAEEVRKITGM